MLGVTMPKAVQIRDVPDDTIAVLRSRAAAAGMSMSEYLRSELVSMAARPTIAEVLARARTRHGGVPRGEIVRVIREMRDAPDER
jgi:plasmid stability protein